MISEVEGGQPDLTRWRRMATRIRVGTAASVGLVVAVVTGLLAPNQFAPMIGWDAGAVTFLLWTWLSIWHRSPEQTRQIATREDPSRGSADAILLSAAVVSLVAVGVALFGANRSQGAAEVIRVLLGVASVALSWSVVHSVFCLQYASLYYGEPGGGIDFASVGEASADPDYGDFAYLAFTIGMTYQVSDTALTSRIIRRTALRHALISFLFGTIILATTINLIAGLSK
ncbi:MAG TPA: DUF1345 domain-containing protein [Kineosporiaceae bacterium]|nr:DUF1345 domain-containing protein [Kineosporiaceae bacterium]